MLYKLFHSVLDQIIKSLNNGTLYFPFVGKKEKERNQNAQRGDIGFS